MEVFQGGKEVTTPQLGVISFAKFRFLLVATADLVLPAYKGSVFHGGFGHALKDVSPAFFQYFFQPTHNGQSAPPPYVMEPPLDSRTHFNVGDALVLKLLLFGPAVQHYSVCFAALDVLGRKLGLGGRGAFYHIEAVTYEDGSGRQQPVFDNGHWCDGSPAVTSTQLLGGCDWTGLNRVKLSLLTRLRLKQKDRLVKEAPSLALLMDRILGRLHTLSMLYCNTPFMVRHQRELLLDKAREISIQSRNVMWDDWSRFSGRQKEWMRFGGLLGDIVYHGNLAPFMPYLKLGEWLHVGGKTSFGLGQYEVMDHD